MVNLYQFISNGSLFRKIEFNDILCAEYTCLQEETKFGIWSDRNYFAFILSGKKMWRTIRNDYEVEEGDILFIKKGANLTHQFFDDQFCAIFVFIPDDFIKAFLQNNAIISNADAHGDLSLQDAVLPVESDQLLQSFNRSICEYLSMSQPPPASLMELKFKELLLSLASNKKHDSLIKYFSSLCLEKNDHLRQVMEKNYAYNLKLEDYATLCHMSLSTFKRNFKQFYQTSPANWLREKKLDLALQKISHTNMKINEITLECGFENTSHFIRVFKKKYNITPNKYRQNQLNQV